MNIFCDLSKVFCFVQNDVISSKDVILVKGDVINYKNKSVAYKIDVIFVLKKAIDPYVNDVIITW